jgi:RHS repeat-associated protein
LIDQNNLIPYGTAQQVTQNVYFAGRLIQSNGRTVVTDRLGSVRANDAGDTFGYYPYGEELTVKNPQDREKFATYTRESATGLDYANQRYYSSTYGRFSRPDPYGDNWDPGNPGSWNMYAYVNGDPVNFNDPDGLQSCGSLKGFGSGQTLKQAIEGSDDAALLGRLAWAESSGSIFAQYYIEEKTAVAVSVVNRWKIDNGLIFIQNASGGYLPTSFGGTSYPSIIGAAGQYASFTKGSNPQLTAGFQKSLDIILSTDISVGKQAGLTDPSDGSTLFVNESCYNVIQSYVAGYLGVNGKLSDPFASKGVTVSFNLGNSNPNPATMTDFSHVGAGAPTYFFGYTHTTTTPPPPPVKREPSARRRGSGAPGPRR